MTISQALRTPAELRSSEGQTPPLSQALRAAFLLQLKGSFCVSKCKLLPQ